MMEMEGEQPVIRTTPYESPMHQYGSSIIQLTNPENEIYKMELTFRSQIMGEDGNPKRIGDPLMNDMGVSSVIGTVQTLVSQVTIMSNLTKQSVEALMDFLSDTLARDLMANRVAYGIKSPASRDKIYFTALSTSYITMQRAFEEGDKRFWKGSVQEIHSRVEQPQKQGGMLSSLNPFRT